MCLPLKSQWLMVSTCGAVSLNCVKQPLLHALSILIIYISERYVQYCFVLISADNPFVRQKVLDETRQRAWYTE